ncbi:MAG: acyl-CoA desaturase [Dehalococcoidia bacterium]|nr:acyl-CoA desaturase [Dehalococcoidia bacterium]
MTAPVLVEPVLSPTAPAPRPRNDYADLKRIVIAQGLLEARPAYYVMKTVVALATLGLAVVIAIVASSPWILLADAVLLAFASTQIALLGHDVGHKQGFRGRRANKVARYFFGNVLIGISHTWWSSKHNQHHANPNHIDKDPDIQFPMVVFAADQIAARSPKLRRIIGFQAFFFPFLFPFQAVNMRITSVQHLLAGNTEKPWLQGAFMALHVVLYGALLLAIGSWPMAIAFAVVHQAVFGLYNSSVFASNHKGMEVLTDSTRKDFLREQVLTSRNVTGPLWVDFWYGGLNYQIEHHLFPTMPRNQLSKAKPIVEQFCRERGVSYHEAGLIASYLEGLRHLHRESAPARA